MEYRSLRRAHHIDSGMPLHVFRYSPDWGIWRVIPSFPL